MYQFDKDLRVIMKLAPVLLGAISAQSGDDADRWDNTDFSLTDNIFTYEAPKDERFDKNSCSTGTTLVIQAVTCWESNHMGDLDHYITTNDDNFGWKNIHHGHDQGAHGGISGAHGQFAGLAGATTPSGNLEEATYYSGLGQGTQESTNYGKRVPSSSPNYQIGTYSRGMKTHGTGTALNMIDYHSAMAFDNRYSGCIYEAAGWNYTADTYNRIWRMSYGYDPTRIETGASPAGNFLNDASGVDRSNTVAIRPNWWHYFNSHILNVGQFDNQFDSYERHLLVMANPAYEGLGYLNWITTFAKYTNNNENASAGGGTADDRGQWGGTYNKEAFTASHTVGGGSGGSMTSGSEAEKYDKGYYRGQVNHNTHDTVTDLYSGGYAFHLAMGCTTNTNLVTGLDSGYTTGIGTSVSYDHQMNPEINTPVRTDGTNTEGTMHQNGYIYDSYFGTGQSASDQDEIREWYSYLISPGSGTINDTSLTRKTDDGRQFYPWMSMAAVSSFPHNDLGQDFRFNIRILHHGGRGFPYTFTGNDTTTPANNNLSTASAYALDPGTNPISSMTANFSIMNAQIKYLAQDSYYWYKVNTIQIGFPSYVRCPRYYRNIASDSPGSGLQGPGGSAATSGTMAESMLREEKLSDTFRCMDSANFNGHRGWDSSHPYNHGNPTDTYARTLWDGLRTTSGSENHRPNVNHPIYVEQLTENDGSAYKGILVNHNCDTTDCTGTDVYDSADGFICGSKPPFGAVSGDGTDYKGEWYKCGQKYAVHGLMNSYDEHAQLEYGTMQEIWFQFWYHYVITWDPDNSAKTGTDPNKTYTYGANHTFWDKRNSNTGRFNGQPDHQWPMDDGVANNNDAVFHNGTHDNVYFTVNNYRNEYTVGSNTYQYDHVHNFPNILFNAFELRGIRFFCDDVNSFNSNTCFHNGKDTYNDAISAANFIGDSMTNP